MEDNGLRYDDERRRALKYKYESLYQIQLLKLKSLLGRDLNPHSPKQVKVVIFDELGYSLSRQVTGTDEESLEYLMVFGSPKHSTPVRAHQILTGVLNCRKIHKVLEYLDTVPYPDGYWRCHYNLAGTETGRTSAGSSTEKIPGASKRSPDQLLVWEEKKKSRNIVLENLGRSFQTIGKHGFKIDGETYGKDLRSIFVPTPGYEFVEVDLSQAEARVDAVLAGNFDILSVFDGPVGIHRLTGSWVFNCDPSEIKKNILVTDPATGITVDRYHMSKTVRHAGERNMQAARLVMMTQQPLRACKIILDTFHEKQPEIREVFHRDIIACIDATRTLVAPNGRRRQFLGRIDHKLYNEAISQLPQAIVSDQLKFSFIDTFAECPWARLINEQHDGALAEVPKGRSEEYWTVFQRNVEKPIDFNKGSLQRDIQLVIPSEVSITDGSWYDLKEIQTK
jgi:hypothetical protein